MKTTITIFPQKPAARKAGILPHHLWPKSVRQDVNAIRRRVKTLRRLFGMASRHPDELTSAAPAYDTLWEEVRTPVFLRTKLSPPPRDLSLLGILNMHDLFANEESNPAQFHTILKGMRRATRILMRHARNLRRMRYGKALLRMFIKKPSMAL